MVFCLFAPSPPALRAFTRPAMSGADGPARRTLAFHMQGFFLRAGSCVRVGQWCVSDTPARTRVSLASCAYGRGRKVRCDPRPFIDSDLFLGSPRGSHTQRHTYAPLCPVVYLCGRAPPALPARSSNPSLLTPSPPHSRRVACIPVAAQRHGHVHCCPPRRREGCTCVTPRWKTPTLIEKVYSGHGTNLHDLRPTHSRKGFWPYS